jgi:hypothetical protein
MDGFYTVKEVCLKLHIARETIRPRRLGFAYVTTLGWHRKGTDSDARPLTRLSSREKLAASWQGVGAVLRPRPFLS